MKKLTLIAFTFVLATTWAAAQQQPLLVGGGLSVTGAYQSFDQDFSEDSGTYSSWEKRLHAPLLARVFATVEVPYLTVDAGLAYQVANVSDPMAYVTTPDDSTKLPLPKGLLQGDLTALVRFDVPIDDKVLMNLLAGGRLDLNLMATDKASMDAEAKANLNNFWLMGGVGYRWTLSDALSFRGTVLVGYDLTPITSSTTVAGYTSTGTEYLGFGFEFSAALMYRL